jgi:glyoxylase-like metal-dependent hydrolase (beta-lactamase superfamily II)
MFHFIESFGVDSNCYILESDVTAVIDTGTYKNYRLYDYVDENDLQIDLIINTHCHYDHIGGNKFFQVPIYAHEKDYLDIKNGSEKTFFWGFSETFEGYKDVNPLKENDEIDLGDYLLKVIHTPGHTSGSMCLLEEDKSYLFSGDTVFKGSVGRYDLPSGSLEDLKESLKKLCDIKVKEVFPGHGESFPGKDLLFNKYMVTLMEEDI